MVKWKLWSRMKAHRRNISMAKMTWTLMFPAQDQLLLTKKKM